MSDYRKSGKSNYIREMRELMGQRNFIHPGARILIENVKGEFLFVQNVKTGFWGLPAGALEWNETIEQCIRREVREETGLELLNLETIGIGTNPATQSVLYPNGDRIQYFSVEFYSNEYTGNLSIIDQAEIATLQFKPVQQLALLPTIEKGIVESLAFYREHQKIRLY